MTSTAPAIDVFFGIDLPRAGTVHPQGVPLLLRGVLALANGPARALHVSVDGRPLLSAALNDTREDVRRKFEPARSHDAPCGYHYYVTLPADLSDGVHRLEFRAEDGHGTTVAAGEREIRLSSTEGDVFNAFPDGHFYSPVVNVSDLVRDRQRVWPNQPEILGIDFRPGAQRSLLRSAFPKFLGDYDYPLDPPEGAPEWSFRRNNPVFGELDARTLFVMLRSIRPARMIEVGSGYTSLLVADVNRRFLDSSLQFTCIEPYPRPFLKDGIPGLARLIMQRVQDVPLETFDELGAGDILFVDSSHVGKTGSDVLHLFFEVIPRLRPGVIVHVHDIFLPHDYPVERVLAERLSWNEQYLLRALLMFSETFEVMFGTSYVRHHFGPELLALTGTDPAAWTGSFWFRKVR